MILNDAEQHKLGIFEQNFGDILKNTSSRSVVFTDKRWGRESENLVKSVREADA